MTLPPPSYLATWVSTRFDLRRVTSIQLLRAYTNDVYLVEMSDARYVLKVYGTNWRHDGEIRFEAELLDHLAAQGILVARAIRGRNGEALQHVAVDGIRRQAMLFEYAAGRKPKPPFPPELYAREGRAVAALHRAAESFRTTHERRALDLAMLIDRPLALVQSLDIDIDNEVREVIVDVGMDIQGRLETLVASGLDWGVCHGDLTFDNLHLTEDGEFVWYDFDSGGYGWRAIDCQGWAALDDGWRPPGQAFLDGYREIRPLGNNDITAAPLLAIAQEIWGIQIDLERRVLAQGPVAVRACFAELVGRFAAWRERLHGKESFTGR